MGSLVTCPVTNGVHDTPHQRRLGNGELRIRNEGKACEASREVLSSQVPVPHSHFR
jgi:hypothetical protein